MEKYHRQDTRVGFVSFLVDEGLLTLDRLEEIHAELLPGAAAVEVRPGSRLSGCVIERKLGQGGMGTVYKARRESDGLAVVVKLLRREHANEPVWRARFLREGLLVKDLVHPNIVRVHAVAVEGDAPHIVMELVEGHDLEDQLAASGRLVPLEAARIGRDVARGLAAAHAHGVIHRDIKPGNIRVTPEGQVKILDFGLSKSVVTDDGISMAGQVLGTPYYMAPEQWGDHDVDARADVWSLGATLYHLVTGRVPFPGSAPMTICHRILEGQFVRPRELVPEIPEDLELVILRMLSREASLRYASAERCAAELDRVLQGLPIDVPCLVEVATGRRHPLLPGSLFTIGRAETCDVRIDDPSVAESHAAIELNATGYHLHDEGSPGGSWLENMRVTSALLRPGDNVRLGDVVLRFHDGGLAATAAVARPTVPASFEGSVLPEAFETALVEAGDRRIVLSLIEQASPEVIEARVASTRAGVRALLGGDVAERAAERLEARLHAQASRAVSALFRITHENLGDDLAAWLRWWERARESYPPQLAAYRVRPSVRLRIVAGESEPRTIELDGRPSWVLGRGPTCDVKLENRSVSRTHATLLRLRDRLVVRDEGSRFGVSVNGKPIAISLLRPGDRLSLAKVEILVQAEDLDAVPPRSEDGHRIADISLIDALGEVGNASVVVALLRFLKSPPEGLAWIDAWAGKLFPDRPERAAAIGARVREIYGARRDEALVRLSELVPELATVTLAPDAMSWASVVESKRAELPPQLVPEAWFPDRRRRTAAPAHAAAAAS
jgi:serine/threonine protein kinase